MLNFLKGISLMLFLLLVSSCSLFNGKSGGFELKINGVDCNNRLKSDGQLLQYTKEGLGLVSTPAYVDGLKFDMNKGIYLKIKFKADSIQSNPYPRLIEGKDVFSLHLAKEGQKQLKFMLLGQKGKYVQAVSELKGNNNDLHEAVVSFDPEKKVMTLQVDGEDIVKEKANVKFQKTIVDTLIIGAEKLKNPTRQFCGLISGITVNSPYSYDGSAEEDKEVSCDSPGIRYVTVSSIPGRHMAFPGVTKMPDGNLAAVFREGMEHVCPYGRICIVFSKDGGLSWSAPVSIADTETDERDPSIHTLPDGRILVTHGGWNSWMAQQNTRSKFSSESKYIEQNGEENFGGRYFLFSKDNGKTWSNPVKSEAFCPHGPLFYEGRFYNPSLETEEDLSKRNVVLFEADSNGENWRKTALIGSSKYAKEVYGDIPVYEEPYTIALKDGTFLTAIRVPSDGYMRISFSKDKGKTWTEPLKTNVKGYPQHLLQLKDGRILATYGYRYKPFGIRACLSSDGGKTWDTAHEIVIRSGGKNIDLGYPVSIELENGEVFTVYYYNDKDHENCFIEGAFFKP